jgi:hypothetical protein
MLVSGELARRSQEKDCAIFPLPKACYPSDRSERSDGYTVMPPGGKLFRTRRAERAGALVEIQKYSNYQYSQYRNDNSQFFSVHGQ